MSELSDPQCVLLAIHFALTGNFASLQAFATTRSDALPKELVLRIILTFVPESTDPNTYTSTVQHIALGPAEDQAAPIFDTAAVQNISETKARKRVERIHLLPLKHPSSPFAESNDPLIQFLIHRAYRIDEATGLLSTIPALIAPFVEYSSILKTWMISEVLPLLRLSYEWYPHSNGVPSLDALDKLNGKRAFDALISKALEVEKEETAGGVGAESRPISRDLRCVVGPWMYGDSYRKRRRLGSSTDLGTEKTENFDVPSVGGLQADEPVQHDWEYVNRWLLETSRQDFSQAAAVFSHWNGPTDVDFAGYDDPETYLQGDERSDLEVRYAQSLVASMYATKDESPAMVERAYQLLLRLAHLMKYDPPPELTADESDLPRLTQENHNLREILPSALRNDFLLRKGNVLTAPSPNSYSVLQLFFFSVRLLQDLRFPLSILEAARIYLGQDTETQTGLLQKIVHGLGAGAKKPEYQWKSARSKLFWLWTWGAEVSEMEQYANGIFGKVSRRSLETEWLKSLLNNAQFSLVSSTYLEEPHSVLDRKEIEATIHAVILHYYDNASNGNRTRGGIKKAADIWSTFRPQFPGSVRFQQVEALLAATHALSFYSLTLQHGVPFQPVSIRVSTDPISLIAKVLEQNQGSYTKLDDLIRIAYNLVAAGLSTKSPAVQAMDDSAVADVKAQREQAERRVLAMAIDAALAEDDFETAYSYVVNRLNPTGGNESNLSRDSQSPEDDISWRAAFAAGRYRSMKGFSGTAGSSAAYLRRLDQRLDLLSTALMIAPPSALNEILGMWRRVEEEQNAALAKEADEDDAHASGIGHAADRSALPGTFELGEPERVVGQPRREIGRTGESRRFRGEGEAPMSLFDVARGAAATFQKSAFPLGRSANESSGRSRVVSMSEDDDSGLQESTGSLERVRKRDMVANAATGALVSGMSWVLGATPSNQQDEA